MTFNKYFIYCIIAYVGYDSLKFLKSGICGSVLPKIYQELIKTKLVLEIFLQKIKNSSSFILYVNEDHLRDAQNVMKKYRK